MNRRDALKGILLACTAPFYVPVTSLMRLKPIVVPEKRFVLCGELPGYQGLADVWFNGGFYFMRGDGVWFWDGKGTAPPGASLPSLIA